ncbi:MAG TPA: PspC domain-containing protein [Acidimicrobiia bacterium]|nr:PspC domain-containing protein [Acidimicrobiia bacterium]
MSNAKRLVRKRDGKMIAGVAAGIADYFEVDVNLIRVILAVTAVMGGFGLVVYLVMWVLVPEEGSDRSMVDDVVDSVTEENHDD